VTNYAAAEAPDRHRSICPADGIMRDLTDLTDRYRRWCRTVSFDNALRWLSLHSDRPPESLDGGGSASLLPGADVAGFWEDHRRHGTGGMCVPTANALCDQLRAAGYDARIVLASIDGAPAPDHVTTVVMLDGRQYVLDTVAMTGRPLPLGDAPVQLGSGLLGATSRPCGADRANDWLLTWRTPAHGNVQTCLVHADRPVDNVLTCYRHTQRSDVFRRFNKGLYARVNTVDSGAVVVLGPFSVTVAPDASVTPGDPAAATLRHVFGWSPDIVECLDRAGAFG
jgi:hypothetical protein